LTGTYHLDQWVTRVAAGGPVEAIEQYLGVRPSPRSFRVLSDAEWKRAMPTDRVDLVQGPLVAMTTPDGDVLVKQGHEGSAIHELLHVVGFRPVGISQLLNEGITQAVAIAVGRAAGLPVDGSYRAQVHWVLAKLLPRLGQRDIKAFARGYVRAPDKGAYIRGLRTDG
jgi:hypothetical protein